MMAGDQTIRLRIAKATGCAQRAIDLDNHFRRCCQSRRRGSDGRERPRDHPIAHECTTQPAGGARIACFTTSMPENPATSIRSWPAGIGAEWLPDHWAWAREVIA